MTIATMTSHVCLLKIQNKPFLRRHLGYKKTGCDEVGRFVKLIMINSLLAND